MNKTTPYIRADIVKAIIKEAAPKCFHCGSSYEKDENHTGPTHTTWKPSCTCLDKVTIRIVTGGEIVFDDETIDPDFWNE